MYTSFRRPNLPSLLGKCKLIKQTAPNLPFFDPPHPPNATPQHLTRLQLLNIFYMIGKMFNNDIVKKRVQNVYIQLLWYVQILPKVSLLPNILYSYNHAHSPLLKNYKTQKIYT